MSNLHTKLLLPLRIIHSITDFFPSFTFFLVRKSQKKVLIDVLRFKLNKHANSHLCTHDIICYIRVLYYIINFVKVSISLSTVVLNSRDR